MFRCSTPAARVPAPFDLSTPLPFSLLGLAIPESFRAFTRRIRVGGASCSPVRPIAFRPGLMAAIALLAACERVPASGPDGDDLLAAVSRLAPARPFVPALSIGREHGVCAPTVAGDFGSEMDCSTDAGTPTVELLEMAARAGARSRSETDAAALHASALIDLIWSGRERTALDRSISQLQRAARLSERPGAVLSDLSAALLVRAARMGEARDLLLAVEAASDAAAQSPDLPAARFNLALALHELGLVDAARSAWAAAADPPGGAWAAEAHERRAVAAAVPAPPPAPACDAPREELVHWASAARQDARTHGSERLLSEWARATLAGDPGTAQVPLACAAAIGTALEAASADASLAAAVRAIRAANGDPGATRSLAVAHLEYARARSEHRDGRPRAARERLEGILSASPAPPSGVLIAWVRAAHGAGLIAEGRAREGEAALEHAWAAAGAHRAGALAATIRFGLATAALRQGRYERARAAASEAASAFAAIGEAELEGGALYLVYDAEIALGAVRESPSSLLRALRALRPNRGSVWLHNLLHLAAEAAETDGLIATALHFQEEGVAVARRGGSAVHLAEALLGRARLRLARSDDEGAAADLAAARVELGRIEPGAIRDWLEADARLVHARTSPEPPLASLDSAVAFFDRAGVIVRLLPALIQRSVARLEAGDVTGATADLDRVAREVGEAGAGVVNDELRASLMEASRAVFDRLALLHLAEGRPEQALAAVEQGRLSPRRADDIARPPALRPAVQRETRVVSYALIADTLLAWVIAPTGVDLRRTELDRAVLARVAERARAGLELGAGEEAVRADLARLHDWAIAPLADLLDPGARELVLVADGEIAALPFAAMFDRREGRYLIERFRLRHATSVADAVRPAGRPAPASTARLLLVADPGLPAAVRAALPALPGAGREGGEVASGYPSQHVLRGEDATAAALTRALGDADVLHFAGHAVLDDARPDRSYLALAPDTDGGGAGRLTASELRRLDVRRLRLVVLSACSSMPTYQRRAGGFDGLAGAMLAAGAGGVVGSLWRVEDEATRALMTRFHTGYRASNDASAALQAAQLEMLHGPDPAHRHPAAWAAFRYLGQ
jgi:CHAT domain-containing protein